MQHLELENTHKLPVHEVYTRYLSRMFHEVVDNIETSLSNQEGHTYKENYDRFYEILDELTPTLKTNFDGLHHELEQVVRTALLELANEAFAAGMQHSAFLQQGGVDLYIANKPFKMKGLFGGIDSI